MRRQPRSLKPRNAATHDLHLVIDEEAIPIKMTRKPAARHFILKMHDHGYIELTLPKIGPIKEAMQFLRKHQPWIADQWRKWLKRAKEQQERNNKREILYRGRVEPITLQTRNGLSCACFAGLHFPIDLQRMSLGRWMAEWLRYQAEIELPQRLAALASRHGFSYRQAKVRNQRTRWGSCSSQRNISLNWRLIQFPKKHADYVMLHELNHLRHLNHSARFWNSLRVICPWMDESENWIRSQAEYLRSELDVAIEAGLERFLP